MTQRDCRFPRVRRPLAAGFTLLELMITLVIAALFLTVGVPSYLNLIRNSRAATNANELVTALTLARSEAVRRAANVTICRSADGAACGGNWTDGWIVFVDGAATENGAPVVSQVLNVWDAPEGAATVTTASGGADVDITWIRFLRRGDTRTTQALPITYTLEIEDCVGNVARDVELNAVGRTRVTVAACS